MDYLQYLFSIEEENSSITVLNLVINGLPSIPEKAKEARNKMMSFKPCYKWITFNTIVESLEQLPYTEVLNLVINGLPSIP